MTRTANKAVESFILSRTYIRGSDARTMYCIGYMSRISLALGLPSFCAGHGWYLVPGS